MTHTVRLVTVWSGPLPNYLPLFLLTAGWNRAFEFLFIADSPAPNYMIEGGLPPNVIWVEQPLPDLLDEMGDALGLYLADIRPYKLCDYKPTFGVSLHRHLAGADFWGHIDCDMILGDLAAFFPHERLDSHDILGLRGRGFIHGPLTLYRNTEHVNTLFRSADGWATTLSDSKMYAFTETCGWWARRGESRPDGTPESFTEAVLRHVDRGDIRFFDESYIDESHPRRQSISMSWTNGTLRDNKKAHEIAYYHLISAKRSPFFQVPTWNSLPDAFSITSAGVRAPSESGMSFHLNRLVGGAPHFARALTSRIASRLEQLLRRPL